MGAGKSMLYSCLLDHRSWFAPSNRCSKHACVLWGTSKSVADAKLCETKAETYQVKNCTYVRVLVILLISVGIFFGFGGRKYLFSRDEDNFSTSDRNY